MKISLYCLIVSFAMRCAFDRNADRITAQDAVAAYNVKRPAVTSNEIALFRPWVDEPSVWLTVARHGENAWHPSFVDILSDYRPIVKKVGTRYEITFTGEGTEDLP